MQRTLLLVDDEENILRSLARLFRQDGYRILTANGGTAGLEILKSQAVGVIVSDQRMPEMTGVEFLSRVKTLYPDTVRIVLSGYTELTTITDAVNQGAVYKFLTKPWEDDLLRGNVEEAFTRYELKQENVRLSRELHAANKDLEQRVADKTRALLVNIQALRVAHDILEQMPLAVLGIDEDGTIVVANRAAQEILGMDALVGRHLESALSPTLACAVLEVCATEPGGALVEFDAGKTLQISCRRLTGSPHADGLVVVLRPVLDSGAAPGAGK